MQARGGTPTNQDGGDDRRDALRFPIAEGINAGKCFIADGTARPTKRMPPLPDIPYVNCDAVSNYYWTAEKDGFDLRTNEFGIIKPPYSAMFLEWTFPQRIYSDGKWMDRKDSQPEKTAAFVTTAEEDDGTGCILVRPVGDFNGHLNMWPVLAGVGYDAHGVYRELANPEGYNNGPRVLITNEKLSAKIRGTWMERGFTELAASHYNLVCLAMSFMHCRGAGVDWVEIPPKIAAARARKGRLGPTQYGIIKVPAGLSSTSTREDRLKATEGQMSAHWVRGHFKTYTADAPLFGNKVGSWWWQPTIRGVGEAVRKPYEVSPG